MPCAGHLNISLNGDCEYKVEPSTVLMQAGVVDAAYTVVLEDVHGDALADSYLRYAQLGQTITVKVIENASTNSCWGTLLVEDKQAPTISCGTVDVYCLDMDAYLPDVSDNCDPNVTAIQVGGTTTLADCDPANNIIKIISRTFVAEDSNGLRSGECTHTINVLGIEKTNIVPPADLIDGMSFVCNSDYPTDANGNPHPDTTGIPMLNILEGGVVVNTIPLWPEISDQCKARMTYDDTVIGRGSCKEKIMRRWSFYDACTSTDPYTHIQMIFVEDTEGPTIDCPTTLTIIGSPVSGQTIPHAAVPTCRLAVNIPPVVTTDNCTDVQRVSIEIDGSPVLGTNGGSAIVTSGPHELKYIASDGCNLSEECVVNIDISDNSPPHAICDKHSVVGLTVDGTVEVDAAVFDDGSFDPCGIGEIHIARLVANECDTSGYRFSPTITLCCLDLGVEVDAVVRVFDAAGLYNECDVKIEVQDKSPANGVCPPDQTINCDYPLDINDLSQFGDATAGNECRSGVEEIDPIIDLGSCNNGTITRRWIGLSTGSDVICTQTISISNPFPFDSENLDNIIIRPRDIDTVGACGLTLLPENLPADAQRPIVLEGNSCDLIGTSYKDETFTFDDSSNACFKIVRTWTILNWCAPADNNTIEWAQIIKVTDTDGPTVVLDSLIQAEYCVSDDNCIEGTVSLSATGSDICTADLTARVLIDLNNDGVINDNGAVSVDQTASGTVATLQYTYPLGTHRVQFVFRDGCGLTTTEDHVFTVKNCKAPTCVLNNLNINIAAMPQGTMACIWASDFEASSSANCPDQTLSYYFDAGFTMADTCYMCTDLNTQTLDIYVVDEFGNHAVCSPMLTITDHDSLCTSNLVGPSITQNISGLITNHRGGEVPEAKVSLSNTEYPYSMTSGEGFFAFNDVTSNRDYNVEVKKNDDHLNGVSTLDLVLIQKHILGIDVLDDPYNMIAADINKSGSISAIDLVELRKLILGEQSEFKSNTSWRFIDKSYDFTNGGNPFVENFPEDYQIVNLTTDMKVDFVGVKVGDVSGNASFNEFNSVESRSNKQLQLLKEFRIDNGSNILVLELSSENFENVSGFQTTLNYSETALEYIGVEGAAIDINSNNVGKRYASKGMLALSWSTHDEITVSEEDVLFKLVFRLKSGDYQNMQLSSSITNTEVYFDGKVSERINLSDKASSFVLDQNVPNPWFDQTEINFNVTENANVNLIIYDLVGKQIHNRNINASSGINKISLNRNDIPNAGIYLYELSDGVHKIINKMIVID